MRTLNLIQGSPEWLASRANRFTASEAPAMMGASKYQSRSALLAQKHSGIAPEVSPAQQALYDRGHAAEAAARTLLEADLGDLFPVTAVHDEDDRMLASVDGITLDDSTLFEHKLASDSLMAQVQSGILDMHYVWQLEHQLYVTSAERVIFVCSDGTRERWAQMEYRAVPGRREQLLAGWAQFAQDLAAYVPPAAAEPAAVAAPMESLPAVAVQVNGALQISSNLDLFGRMLREFVGRIPKQPSTDQEFADTDAACKALKKAEEALDQAEAGALAQVSTVEQLQRTVGDLRKLARDTRLAAEKVVKARKEQLRTEAVQRGRAALAEHVASLNASLGRPYMPTIPENFAGCISGLKSLDSIRNAVDTELARCKIAANEAAEGIRANLAHLTAHAAEFKHLFPDTATLVLRPLEVVQATVQTRIAEHRAAEEARAAALAERERARIRAEEEARAREQARQEQEARQAAQASPPALPPAAAPIAPPAPATQAAAPAPQVVPIRPAAAPVAQQPTLTLGAICDRLGFNVSGLFLSRLGIEPVAKVKAASLYTEAQWDQLCEALVAHIRTVHHQRKAA